jgi:hypothetical protein
MFWNLTLAHLVGDYFLQPDWMVRQRDKWWVLVLHGSIHLGLILLFLGKTRSEFWFISILIALLHLSQDALKISLVKNHPTWATPAYLVDQALHLGLIWSFIRGFQVGAGSIPIYQKNPWVMIAIASLFVTYIWYISEKTFSGLNPAYIQDLKSTKIQRMLTRSVLASLFLASRLYAYPVLAAAFINPYTNSSYPRRAFWTDISISVLAGLFLFWGLE